ncbi:DUF2937 family protein [Roseibium sp. Sym1]|uniref:DUF2937 family protein n=1 Tax=Roseibium sp. Sym1 TaxID=3016006 RepID=UPI0022B2CF53|nr:DUF2937 family protein [Roseibium sp. Sym1]
MARVLMLIVMLVSGTATSQLPEFSQQYRQRLGGAIDALQEILADFNRDAAAHGLTTAEAIARQKESEDPFIRARGTSMLNAEIRLSRLKQQQAELETAGPVQRLMIFARGFDPQLAQATAEDYEPAVPVTATGFVTAGVGALAGLLTMRLLIGVGRLGRRRGPRTD